MNSIINEKIHIVPRDIELVVGVPRSGILPAAMIALLLNCQMTDLDSFLRGEIYSCGKTKSNAGWIDNVSDAKKILVVDDSICSGNALNDVIKKIEDLPAKPQILTLCVYAAPATKDLIDIYMEIVPVPRMFEWNYLHHGKLGEACFDIDGVLCCDPTPEQNDDGSNYKEFILNAPVKYRPTAEIGCLVTSRLEKYRKETELWLKKNNIAYKKLVMLQLSSMEERQKLNCHGQFKAQYYKKATNSNIFIESEPAQAVEIANLTKKPVYCTGNQEFYAGDGIYSLKVSTIHKMARFKRMIKKLPFVEAVYKNIKKLLQGNKK